jgi:hypothetical protein
VLRLAIVHLPDRIAVQAEEDRSRIAEDDRRVRRNEELGVSRPFQVVNDPEERELPLRRERGFRLVQDEDPLLEAIREQGQERLPVRLLVQGLAPVGA